MSNPTDPREIRHNAGISDAQRRLLGNPSVTVGHPMCDRDKGAHNFLPGADRCVCGQQFTMPPITQPDTARQFTTVGDPVAPVYIDSKLGGEFDRRAYAANNSIQQALKKALDNEELRAVAVSTINNPNATRKQKELAVIALEHLVRGGE